MSMLKLKDGTELYYKDWGTGQPIVFHHGWPLSSDDWDAQMMFFLQEGFRVIAMTDAVMADLHKLQRVMKWIPTLQT